MDATSIAAIVGATTGCVSLIWNILTHVGFDLEIYSFHLSFERDAGTSKEILKYTGRDITKYSDDAVILRGWFKFLLRKEGQRFKNHHVDSLSIVICKELKETLSSILAEQPSWLPLFAAGGNDELRLLEGAPTEVRVHSNPLYLRKDSKSLTNLEFDELLKKLNNLITKEEEKIYVTLTTYKYPLAFEKKGDWFHREHLWKRTVNSIRWRLKN